MATLFTCSRCGDLMSETTSACPTCGTRRSGAEAVVVRPSASSELSTMTAVVIKDFDMPFGSMVSFMVKWAIAAIPAVIILFVIFGFLGAIMGGFFASLLRN
jgi:RNA polymerase subunit RPABC4/transcription elongation factor Spt4